MAQTKFFVPSIKNYTRLY